MKIRLIIGRCEQITQEAFRNVYQTKVVDVDATKDELEHCVGFEILSDENRVAKKCMEVKE